MELVDGISSIAKGMEIAFVSIKDEVFRSLYIYLFGLKYGIKIKENIDNISTYALLNKIII